MKIIMSKKELTKTIEVLKYFDIKEEQVMNTVQLQGEDYVYEIKYYDLIVDVYKSVIVSAFKTAKSFIADLEVIKNKTEMIDEIIRMKAELEELKKEKEEKENADEVKDAEQNKKCSFWTLCLERAFLLKIRSF